MGQRRFRVSMGVLIAPKTGDASIKIIPQMKKHTTSSDESSKSFISTISKRHAIKQNALIIESNYDSINSMNKDSHNHSVTENTISDDMSNSTIHDSCQFPYYRSNKSNGCPDAVLVKDIGVSCMLLNQNTSEISPETKTIVKHLKKEYNDLSNITSKITTYTKDILSHLSKKNQKKQQFLKNLVSSKHAMASQYIDTEGNLCLKLRLFSNAETQCITQQDVKNFNSILCKDGYNIKKLYSKHSQISSKESIKVNNTKKNSKYEKDIQTLVPCQENETNTSTSTSPSASSVFNYLILSKKRTSNEFLNSKSNKFGDMHKHRHLKNFIDKDGKDHLKIRNPILFTNWKEISKSKSKNKTFFSESQQTTNTKNKILQGDNMINNISNTKFHTVNIRIIKKSKKNV
ncbi:uncharacterized protein LOC100577809 isoform X2 [Apis mellifera]|nr:uncharacterized protein LOC100577809 isoform X2 [Apis mellifera]|eukprot:XP_026299477.1 uncharacterized protein LOC100577809 isoform X2 [Apis mellifera]